MPRKIKSAEIYRCRDCGHAYDFHSMSLENKPILCRCPFEKASQLLSRACVNNRFKQK